MIYIVGLLAKSGHGKTTVARHLAQHHGADIRSIAGPMKRAAQKMFGFSDAQMWGTQLEKEAIDSRYGFSPRWILQRMGAEGLRDEFGEDVHMRALVRAIRLEQRERPAEAKHRFIVVDDVRFPGDARFLSVGGPDYRGVVLKLVCTDAPVPGGAGATHASELGIDLVDPQDIAATIVSSRAQGIEHLWSEVRTALAQDEIARLLSPVLGPRDGTERDALALGDN